MNFALVKPKPTVDYYMVDSAGLLGALKGDQILDFCTTQQADEFGALIAFLHDRKLRDDVGTANYGKDFVYLNDEAPSAATQVRRWTFSGTVTVVDKQGTPREAKVDGEIGRMLAMHRSGDISDPFPGGDIIGWRVMNVAGQQIDPIGGVTSDDVIDLCWCNKIDADGRAIG